MTSNEFQQQKTYNSLDELLEANHLQRNDFSSLLNTRKPSIPKVKVKLNSLYLNAPLSKAFKNYRYVTPQVNFSPGILLLHFTNEKLEGSRCFSGNRKTYSAISCTPFLRTVVKKSSFLPQLAKMAYTFSPTLIDAKQGYLALDLNNPIASKPIKRYTKKKD